jgi:DNA repair protein RadC
MDGGGDEENGAKTGKPARDGPSRHYHGHRERLRDRVLRAEGPELADYELLETLLCAFIPRVDTKPIAKDLLARFKSVSAVLAAPPERLKEVAGIGDGAAAYMKAVHLLTQRATAEGVKKRVAISNWSALETYVKSVLQHEASEQVRVLFLDRKNGLIEDRVMGRGTVDHAPVYPREIAKRALEISASAVILVHNHPSGDPTPSRADIEMTREIEKTLAALDIKLHDHLVVGTAGALSMKAKGLF